MNTPVWIRYTSFSKNFLDVSYGPKRTPAFTVDSKSFAAVFGPDALEGLEAGWHEVEVEMKVVKA